jgi:threonyl-tRNA synthetase
MLSTRPDKAVGSDEIWDKATAALKDALGKKGWAYQVDEGGGAFYGPKIDIKIKDAIGRLWQCSTVQCDFNLPQRFGMEYVTAEGTKAQPIMLHRAVFGSIERFFGVLIESTAGDFPFWLAPTQLRLLPVSDDFLPYCQAAVAKLAAAGVRAEVDQGGRSVGKQIKIANQVRRSRCSCPFFLCGGVQPWRGRTRRYPKRAPRSPLAPQNGPCGASLPHPGCSFAPTRLLHRPSTPLCPRMPSPPGSPRRIRPAGEDPHSLRGWLCRG